MRMKRVRVVPHKTCNYWDIWFEGGRIGIFRTPREAKHKARMWWMWLTTGDETYLRKEQ